MHYLEWQNAGNSGKLLVKCLGETSVKILIYGRKQDDEHLIELVAQNPRGAAILFPRPGGKLLKDFVQACLKDVNSNDAHFGPIILIALDATYSKAKTMAKHLERILPSLTMVQLDPTNLVPSSFGRAQKYSKSNPHRVCTTEAVAVALFECGEPAETMSTLMQAVKTNHTAVDPGQARRL